MNWFGNVWLLTAACFAWASVVVYLTDPLALPRDVARRHRIERTARRVVIETAARLPIIAIVFAGFFAISWRPLYAAQGTLSFFIIFTAISRAKFIFIREPLVFSDIALVADVFKHKEIFYATKLNVLFWIIACSYVFGASALFYYFEPSILPARNRVFWIVVGLCVAFGPHVLIFVKPINVRLRRISESLLQTLDVFVNTVRFGTFASVIYHFLIWIGTRRDKIVAELMASLQHAFHEIVHADDAVTAENAPLVVVWQSESFYDLRHFGVPDLNLPNLDGLKARAVQSGRMTSVFEGGYTLRTEFAVLSGLQPEDAHADASYPYLRAAHYSDIVWPMRLKRAGWLTHFVHPYEKTFFFRDKAMPLLGFDNMTMLDGFAHNPDTDGPYVSDRRLTKMVVDIIDGIGKEQPAFVFVASMGNHGPWLPGRCGDLTDPVEIYTELLRKSDEALGHLVAYLDRLERPVWLAFYGDHAPLLKTLADPFPDPRTDYALVPLARAGKGEAETSVKEEAPWNLLGTLFTHADVQRRRTE
ncbi:LTA synthase family protein [Shinella sp. BYT-45]|uniref:LTA synthase family protein n=1 Tax=Shinella sp. BYT-45 TaxID=3377377 RepID=UPI00397F3A1C